jgi:hypothetical protein
MANDVRVRSTFVDKISGPISRIQDKFDHLGASGTFKSLVQGVGMGAGIAAFNLLGQAANKAVEFIGDSVGAASDLNEAMTKSDAVFGDAAVTVQKWASSASDAFGQSKRSALEAAGTYGNLFQAFGIARDQATQMSMSLVELASDLASFNNTSVDDALIALRSGLSGETEPLKRFGVALSDVRLKEEALRMGLIKTTSGVLPAAIKTQAAYALIMKDTALAQGDYARTSDGLANTQKSLDAALENVQAEIGEKLMPAMLTLASFAKDELVPAIAGTIDVLEDAGGALTFFGEVVNAFTSQGTQAAQIYARHIEREAKAAADAIELEALRTARSGDNVAAAIRSRASDMGRSLDRAGDSFEGLADRAVTSFSDMVDALQSETTKLIGDVFDPIETRAAIYQQRMEQNAAEERLRDAETAREKREATDDIMSSIRRQADGLIDLGDQGNLTKKDVDRFETDVRQSYAALGKKVPADIQKIIDKLRELDKWDGHRIQVQVRGLGGAGIGSGGSGRAAGGPVQAGVAYTVGEVGRELFVPNENGTIIPNHRLGSGGSGGVVNNFYLTVKADVLTPGSARELADAIGPMLTSWQQRNGLLPRTASPLRG